MAPAEWDDDEDEFVDDDDNLLDDDDLTSVTCDLCGDEYESWEVGRCEQCGWLMCDGCTGENGCCVECNRAEELNEE